MCQMVLATREEEVEEKEREGEEVATMAEEDTMEVIIRGIRNLAIMGPKELKVEVVIIVHQELKVDLATITRAHLEGTKASHSNNSRTANRTKVAREDMTIPT